MDDKRYMDAPGVMAYLGISKHTLSNWIKDRKMPYLAFSKRTYRFDKEEIDRWAKTYLKTTVADQMNKMA